MNKEDYALTVQSKSQDVRSLVMHYQEDPFPGGLSYSLEIRDGEFIKPLLEKYGCVRLTMLPRQEASWIFNFLDLMLGLKHLRGEPKFWLNNIAEMELTPDKLFLAGVCSPHQA